MSEPLGIGTTIRSSCPGAAGRLLPDRLAISFSTDPEGNIASLAAPLDPLVKEVVFPGAAAGDCTNPAFRQHCTRTFSHGGTIVLVGQAASAGCGVSLRRECPELALTSCIGLFPIIPAVGD